MEPDIRLLYIHGEPDLQLIKQAKASLAVDWKIVPKTAYPGDTNVLCWGSKPEWVAEYALAKVWTVEKLADAILALCDGKKDARVVSMAQSLEKMFNKKGVREI